VSVPGPAAAIVRRVLPAPPDLVYKEWLEPEALRDWMCPFPARAGSIELEPRTGGRLRIEIDDGDDHFFVVGQYLALDPPNRLSFTWSCSNWPDPNLESVVMVTLEAHSSDQTLMTIEHTLLPGALVERHRQGWTQISEQLAENLLGPRLRRSPDTDEPRQRLPDHRN
jgi:uncharacterized protein YndB with AHSA1/START domain